MNPLSFGRRVQYALESAVFFLFIGFFRIFGVDTASAIGGFIGREILYRLPLSRRARSNIALAFPDKSAEEVDAILRGMWDNLGRTAGEYGHLSAFRIAGKDARITGNFDRIEKVLAAQNGKGILIISGHFANWELMPFAAAQYGIEGGVVYRPVNNPTVDRWMVNARIVNGLKDQIAKGPQGTRRIFTLLRSGKAVLLLADQKTNEGLPVPFFGRDAMTTPAPATLALKLGATILPVRNERIGGAHFRLQVHDPIDFTPTGDQDEDVYRLTQKINDALEAMVRANPSQWLWLHRRWPKPGDKPRSRRGREAAARQSLSGAGAAVDRDGSSRT
ncbi:MAG: lauroyl acyltransferase [Alphaproteobacteria bacterium]|nr:lauroyl acyltransferase [Alphaproteobacteria bacterium]